MDKVVHFEIPTDDVVRAREFYGAVFGWGLQPMEEMGYTMVTTAPVDDKTHTPAEPGAINGGMMARSDATPHPVITIQVDSIDDSMKQVQDKGGSVVKPKADMGGMGWFAYFKDSEGNILGLWENA
jgi:predicted enzyme related to lactoylglutathione lyase